MYRFTVYRAENNLATTVQTSLKLGKVRTLPYFKKAHMPYWKKLSAWQPAVSFDGWESWLKESPQRVCYMQSTWPVCDQPHVITGTWFLTRFWEASFIPRFSCMENERTGLETSFPKWRFCTFRNVNKGLNDTPSLRVFTLKKTLGFYSNSVWHTGRLVHFFRKISQCNTETSRRLDNDKPENLLYFLREQNNIRWITTQTFPVLR